MSNIVSSARDFTSEQVALIRKSIAPTATPQEFDLFIYRCKHMDLDPLKPGQIHFVKYGTGPGTIIVGIEGFRVRAAKTGKHSGTKRGVTLDENGKCVSAWCEVYRSDWKEPAREEVPMSEYTTGKNQWAKMPQTMLKKVAECAALRMAFPDELGGVYEKSEMDQAEELSPRDVSPDSVPQASPSNLDEEPLFIDDEIEAGIRAACGGDEPPKDPKVGQAGNFEIKFGKYSGATIRELVEDPFIGPLGLRAYITWIENSALKNGKPISADARFLKKNFEEYERELMGGKHESA